jgi:hypothetical protein
LTSPIVSCSIRNPSSVDMGPVFSQRVLQCTPEMM